MQKKVAKLAFRWDKSYTSICEDHGIETLKKRREVYIDNFVQKALDNPRYSDNWFPRRGENLHNLRARRPYKENKAKTSRYYNSPLSYMKRRANDLHSELFREVGL